MGSSESARTAREERWHEGVHTVAARAVALVVVVGFALTGGPAAFAATLPVDQDETVQPAEGDDASGEEETDDAGEVTEDPVAPPSAPDQPAVTAQDQALLVSWQPPHENGGAALTGYLVELSTDGAVWTSTSVAADSSLVATLHGLVNGTTYQVRVRAENPAGVGDPSPVQTGMPVTTAGPVRSLSGTAGVGSIALRWVAPENSGGAAVLGYTVRYSTDGVSWTSVDLSASASSHTITGLRNGSEYLIQVAASTGIGPGAAAEAIRVTPGLVPTAVRSVTATPGNGNVALAWTAPASDGGLARTGYIVQYSLNGSTWTTASSSVKPSASGYTITGLKNGTTYWVRVLARNSAGNGPGSVAASATPRTVSSAPRSVKVAAASGKLTVTWTAPSSTGGAARTYYLVQYSTNGTTWKTASSTVKPSATSYTISGLKNGTSYKVRVLARNAAGNSSWSSVVTGSPRTVSSAPRSVKVSAGAGKLTVRWTAPSSTGGAARTYYLVQYSTNGTTWKTASSTVKPSATSYTISGLKNGTSYKVRVLARNAAGNGAWSSVVTGKPRTVPSAPKVSAASAGSGKIKVSWAAPSNGGAAITGYLVQQYSGGKWRTVKTVSASARSVTISGLKNGTSYKFRVVAKNAVGTGKWSATVTAKPKAASACHSAYSGACVPIASDVDCAGGSGNGPAYVKGPVYVRVRGVDPYRLDADGDGIACER